MTLKAISIQPLGPPILQYIYLRAANAVNKHTSLFINYKFISSRKKSIVQIDICIANIKGVTNEAIYCLNLTNYYAEKQSTSQYVLKLSIFSKYIKAVGTKLTAQTSEISLFILILA